MSSVKLTPQLIFALVTAACLTLGYLFFTMVIQPKQEAITALNDEITTRQMTLSADQAKAAQVLPLTAEVTKLEADRADFMRALPATANFGKVVEDLKRSVNASGVKLASLNVGGGGGAGAALPAGVRPIGMTLALEGTFSQMFEILRSLELQGRFTTIDSLSLQTANAEKGGGKLSGNMGLTVYTFDAAQAGSAAAAAGTPAATPAAPPAEPAPGGKP